MIQTHTNGVFPKQIDLEGFLNLLNVVDFCLFVVWSFLLLLVLVLLVSFGFWFGFLFAKGVSVLHLLFLKSTFLSFLCACKYWDSVC